MGRLSLTVRQGWIEEEAGEFLCGTDVW